MHRLNDSILNGPDPEISRLTAELREAEDRANSFATKEMHTERRAKKSKAERDHWKRIARHAGVCMTCRGPNGAPEPYGCSDCLNTGWSGEYHNGLADAENERDQALARAAAAAMEMPERVAGVLDEIRTIISNGDLTQGVRLDMIDKLAFRAALVRKEGGI